MHECGEGREEGWKTSKLAKKTESLRKVQPHLQRHTSSNKASYFILYSFNS